MLHLFKKIYLEIDEKMNTFNDRVVISKNHGFQIMPELQESLDGKLFFFSQSLEDLIGQEKSFHSFTDMMENISDLLQSRNKPITIYTDSENYLKIVCNWYKLILKECDSTNCFNMFKSFIFREKLFSGGRLNISKVKTQLDFTEEQFKACYDTITINEEKKKEFIENNKKYFSVEFLLSSYLYDGSLKEELKNTFKILIKKDLEKYFYELKEIILVHMLRKSFQNKLETTKEYDFSNFYDMPSDNSPIVNVFFKKEVWNSQGLFRPSTSGNINFENLSPDDVDNIMKFTEIAGDEWEEENYYRFTKSDMNKLSFLNHVTKETMTDLELQEIIEFELRSNHAAGTFYSIDLETVNNYFIDFLFICYKNNEKEKIRPYIL